MMDGLSCFTTSKNLFWEVSEIELSMLAMVLSVGISEWVTTSL